MMTQSAIAERVTSVRCLVLAAITSPDRWNSSPSLGSYGIRRSPRSSRWRTSLQRMQSRNGAKSWRGRLIELRMNSRRYHAFHACIYPPSPDVSVALPWFSTTTTQCSSPPFATRMAFSATKVARQHINAIEPEGAYHNLMSSQSKNDASVGRPDMKFSRRRTIAAAAGLAAAGMTGCAARAAMARYYDGPVSDHFDGTNFFDPHGTPPKGILDMIRWWAGPAKTLWPVWAPSPFADRPPARVAGSAWRISYVGHASLLLQTAGLNLLIDPVWSERASPFTFAGPRRVNDPGIAFEALPSIDAVLVSHNHYDHLDVATLARLAATHRPRVVTPLGNDTIMRAHDAAIAAEPYDWHHRIVLGDGVAVTLVPVRHWSARGLFDRNRALWAGFVIETPAGRIFHVADSGYGEGRHFRAARERDGPLGLAVLPG